MTEVNETIKNIKIIDILVVTIEQTNMITIGWMAVLNFSFY